MASINRLSKAGDAPQSKQMSTKHLANMAALEAQQLSQQFDDDCNRWYTSNSGTATPCRMVSSKGGRSIVMFRDGTANVASSQLAHRWGKAEDSKQMVQQAKQKAQHDKLSDARPESQGEPTRRPTRVPPSQQRPRGREHADGLQANEPSQEQELQSSSKPPRRGTGWQQGGSRSARRN